MLEEPGLVCEYDRLDAVAKAQLLEDVGDVGLDGGLADVELLSDLCVGEAVGDQPQDLLLAAGQFIELFGRYRPGDAGELFDDTFGDGR